MIASASERLLYTLDVRFAAGGLGHVVRRALSHRDVWAGASAGHSAGQSALYAVLRKAHTLLAYLLFLTFLAHLSAVLFHTLIIRDRLLDRMALWPAHSRKRKTWMD